MNAKISFFRGCDQTEKTPLSKFTKFLIHLFDGEYIHVEIEIHGVRFYAMSENGVEMTIKDRLCAEEWSTIDVDIPEISKTLDFLRNQLGKKYDWLGVIMSVVLPLNIENDNHWFCSELVRRALREGGFEFKSSVGDHTVSPNELYKELQ